MEKLIVLLYIITYIIVYIFKIPCTEDIMTISSLFSIVIIIYGWYKIIKEKNAKRFLKSDLYINLIILVYGMYKILVTIFVQPNLIMYTVANIIPILTVSILLYFFRENKKLTKGILKIMGVAIAICFIASIVVYIFDIDTIQISFREIIKTYTGSENIAMYGERRLTYFFTHKAKYAMFILSIYMLVNYFKLTRLKKNAYILTSCLLIIWSSSITMLGIYICVVLINEIYRKRDTIKKYFNRKVTIISIIITTFVGSAFIMELSNRTGILTLGYRVPIWIEGIKYHFNNIWGVIKQNTSFEISTGVNEGFNAVHSHNVFIQELIGYGAISLILLSCILIIIALKFYKLDKSIFVCFIGILIAFNFDILIDMEAGNIFWYIIPLVITLSEDKMEEIA